MSEVEHLSYCLHYKDAPPTHLSLAVHGDRECVSLRDTLLLEKAYFFCLDLGKCLVPGGICVCWRGEGRIDF